MLWQPLWGKSFTKSSPSQKKIGIQIFHGVCSLEKVKARSLRSMAKVIGTVICVGGATAMAFLKGPRLLSMEFRHLLLGSATDKWVVGALFLIGSSCCWSFWLILQVPICNDYLDPLSLSTWMCLISTFQSATITFFLEPQLSSWKITSLVELLSCLFAVRRFSLDPSLYSFAQPAK